MNGGVTIPRGSASYPCPSTLAKRTFHKQDTFAAPAGFRDFLGIIIHTRYYKRPGPVAVKEILEIPLSLGERG